MARALFAGLHDQARRRGAIFLKVEPPLAEGTANADLLAALGFQPSAQRVQPLSTIVVDLSPSLAAIGGRFKTKWRYNVGLAARRGVTVRAGGPEDVAAWYRLMEVTGRRDGFGIHPEAYYRRFFDLMGPRARLLLAEHEGQLLAGIAVTAFGAAGHLHVWRLRRRAAQPDAQPPAAVGGHAVGQGPGLHRV